MGAWYSTGTFEKNATDLALSPCQQESTVPSFIKPILPEKSEMMLARIVEKPGMISMPTIANIAVINWMIQYSISLFVYN
jgi:hypothetical protein